MVIPSAGYGAASRTVSLVWGYASHWASFFFCVSTPWVPQGQAQQVWISLVWIVWVG